MDNVFSTLKARGFMDAVTSHDLINEKKIKIYVGFDPTADSLHVGNLMAMMLLAWFQRFGHEVVAVVGGATGMIGDPSGRSSERNLLDNEALAKNIIGIKKSLSTVLKFEGKSSLLNNYDWFKDFQFIDFLRDVGRHFRVGTMLAKDSVKARMTSEEGMSFTEFSYQLLQAYDFYYLHQHHGVTLQGGGSDQWGNIVAGTELIRKMGRNNAYGITYPLLTRSDGKKFGKSEEGAVWLNDDKLSPYDFYQYFMRIPDNDVIKLFKFLTFVPLEEISAIEEEMKKTSYVPNTAQKRLAAEITKLVHGEVGLKKATEISQAASPGAKTTLNSQTLDQLAHELPTHTLTLAEVMGSKIIDLMVRSEAISSKGEARRLVANGGAYLNNQKIDDEDRKIEKGDLIDSTYLLLGVGKKKKVVIRIKS